MTTPHQARETPDPDQEPPLALPGRRHRLLGAIALTGCLSPEQQQGVDLVAASRAQAGKSALKVDFKVTEKAQNWSKWMAATDVLQHSGGGNKVNPSGIPNWCAIGENVGKGGSVAAVHALFMQSPPHRANILGNYDRVAVGVVKDGSTYWVTQIFVKSC